MTQPRHALQSLVSWGLLNLLSAILTPAAAAELPEVKRRQALVTQECSVTLAAVGLLNRLPFFEIRWNKSSETEITLPTWDSSPIELVALMLLQSAITKQSDRTRRSRLIMYTNGVESVVAASNRKLLDQLIDDISRALEAKRRGDSKLINQITSSVSNRYDERCTIELTGESHVK